MLDKKLIFIDQDLNSDLEIIRFLSKVAQKNGCLYNQEDFIKSVLIREKEFPTSFGHRVAIPHGKSDSVKKPFIAVCRTKREFFWGRDRKKVQLVFMIGVPEKEKGSLHLKILSQLSRNLMNESFRNCLTTCQTVEKMFSTLETVEKEIILH